MSHACRIAIKGLLLGWMVLAVPAVAGEAADATATPEALPDYQAMLGKAMQAINDRLPEKAIPYLDPIIEHFEAQVSADGPRFYSANSMAEVIMYSALDAANSKEKAPGRDSVVLDGTWSSALHLKGYALIDLERYDEAKAVLRRGTEVAPMYAPTWNELGAILQDQKNWPEALAAYKQAETAAELASDKKDKQVNTMLTRALRGQGFVLIETGELRDAQKLYKRCLKLDPQDDTAKHELAYIDKLKHEQKK